MGFDEALKLVEKGHKYVERAGMERAIRYIGAYAVMRVRRWYSNRRP